MSHETILSRLRRERDELGRLSSAISHCLQIASAPDLLTPSPDWEAVRWIPTRWGFRRDGYFWDHWGWKPQGEENLSEFLCIAERIAKILQENCSCEKWAALLPGSYPEVMGTSTDLFLSDYWVLAIYHVGWQGFLPYECKRTWVIGDGFDSPSYRLMSRFHQSLVRASIDTLTLLIDAIAIGPDVLNWRRDPPQSASRPELPWKHVRASHLENMDAKPPRRSRRREKRASDIDVLTKEMREHLRLVKSTAKSTLDFGRDPQVLPRPSKQELGRRVGLPEYAVTRCFQDSAAKELNVLYEGAEDLQFVLDWRG